LTTNSEYLKVVVFAGDMLRQPSSLCFKISIESDCIDTSRSVRVPCLNFKRQL